jgi:hypothetical protein
LGEDDGITSSLREVRVEIAKLVVAALTPLSVALIGVMLAVSTRRFERSRWLNQKLIEKRIELLSDALPKLNDLYCYFCWIGGWASFSPADMLQHKRDLDRLFHANQAFFSTPALAAYTSFADALFKTYTAPGVAARLRTGPTARHGDRSGEYSGKWNQKWDLMFAYEEERTDVDLVKQRYKALVACLGAEVGATSTRPDGTIDDRAMVL